METAIRIIQKIERGRQGIARAQKAVFYQKKEAKRRRKQENQGENFSFDN